MATGPMRYGASNQAGNDATVLNAQDVSPSAVLGPAALAVTHVTALGTSGTFGTAVRAEDLTYSGVGLEAVATRGKALGGEGGTGVLARGNPDSGYGVSAEGYTGVAGRGNQKSGYGVSGSGDTGVQGFGHTGIQGYGQVAVSGSSLGSTNVGGLGVLGSSEQLDGIGVTGTAYNGPKAVGVYGRSSTGSAGKFVGNVSVSGILTVSGRKMFKIDHPLDPENKYLYHTSVESPEVLSTYSGNAVTDSDGNATVKLPDYCDALNGDFRYQLTVIGELATAAVSQEIRENEFRIKTDRPNVKVSWQVTGVRHDPAIQAHSMVTEQDKPESERGTYLDPGAFNQPIERGLEHVLAQKTDQYIKEQQAAAERSSQRLGLHSEGPDVTGGNGSS